MTTILNADFYHIGTPDPLGCSLALGALKDGDRGFVYPGGLIYGVPPNDDPKNAWMRTAVLFDRRRLTLPYFPDGGSEQMRVWNVGGQLYCEPWPALLQNPLEGVNPKDLKHGLIRMFFDPAPRATPETEVVAMETAAI